MVDSASPSRHAILRNFSPGQQQFLLLSILLFSKSNSRLVIDQPEDNLDIPLTIQFLLVGEYALGVGHGITFGLGRLNITFAAISSECLSRKWP